jgi:hypothetical protein
MAAVAGDRHAFRGQRLIAARVIGVGARVDDHADRLIRDCFNGLEHAIGHVGRTAVDEDYAILSDMHRDVAAGTEDHIDVRADLNCLELVLLGEHGHHPANRQKTQRESSESV